MNEEGNECVCISFLCAKIQEAHLNPNDSERQLIKLSPTKHAHKIALSHFSWVEFLLQSSAAHRNPGVSFLPAVIHASALDLSTGGDCRLCPELGKKRCQRMSPCPQVASRSG